MLRSEKNLITLYINKFATNEVLVTSLLYHYNVTFIKKIPKNINKLECLANLMTRFLSWCLNNKQKFSSSCKQINNLIISIQWVSSLKKIKPHK